MTDEMELTPFEAGFMEIARERLEDLIASGMPIQQAVDMMNSVILPSMMREARELANNPEATRH